MSNDMILMAVPSSSEVVGIIASAALLTPLVRELHKWHIDARKTSKPNDTGMTHQSQSLADGAGSSRWSRMTRFEKWDFLFNLSGYVLSSAFLLLLLVLPAHPATSRDVVLVGVVVSLSVASRLGIKD